MRNNILRNYLLSVLVFCAFVAQSQNVGINTTDANPNASAILDLNTGNTGHVGFLAPQAPLISAVDVATIAAPAIGLIVYNSNAAMTNGSGKGYYYWNGTDWVPTSGTAGDWLITGNSSAAPGTDYIGTNDANALEFKVNGQNSGWIDYLNTTANTFYGYQAGINNTGQYNLGIGYQALNANTSGNTNTGAGYGALFSGTTGSSNTAVGYDALYHNTVNNNTAIGYYALVTNSTGINNTSMGYESNWLMTNQNGNTALGAYSLQNNLSGWNTAIGYQAGYENTSGSYNTWLGLQSGASAGNYNNATAIGALSYVGADNVMELGSINGINTATNDINVGIGTDIPTQKLQVNNGNILISNYNIGSDGATVGQFQLQGTGTGISTFQAGAQGATNYNYTLPTTAPTVGSLVGVSTYAAPNVSLGYVGQPSGVIIGIKIITSTIGATAFDAGTTFIVYKIIGGGGAGGGCDFTTVGGCISSTSSKGEMAGAGGGAGGYSEGQVIGITGGTSTYAVTIGAGGVGQAACGAPVAGDGGTTTLTLTGPATVVTAPGGKCGPTIEEVSSNDSFYNTIGGAGGLPINPGAYNVQGGTGGFASIDQVGVHSSQSGPGGSSIFGGAASGFVKRTTSTQNGNPANSYGSGGGGGVYPKCSTVNATATGGNGFKGIVIIYEYQ